MAKGLGGFVVKSLMTLKAQCLQSNGREPGFSAGGESFTDERGERGPSKLWEDVEHRKTFLSFINEIFITKVTELAGEVRRRERLIINLLARG